MSDPANVVALDQIRALAREDLRIEQVLARESDITIGIEHHYGFELSIDGILNEIETGEIDYQSLAADFDEYSQPVVRLVDALLNDAVKRSASDIHFEPEQGFLRIRYRIDGVLRQIRSLHKNYWAGDGGAPEGDERHEHRRDARAAGRAHLAACSRATRSTSACPRSPRRTARTSCCASSTATRASCRSRTWACTPRT